METPDVLLAALERANDAVVIIDSDDHVSHFNAAAEALWGFDRADVLGLHVSGLGLKDLPQPGGNATDQVRKSEITIEHRDGSKRRIALSLSSVEVGGQNRTIAYIRDITRDIVRRERMAVLELVADKTNRAVIVTDRNLKIVYTNAAFTAMFGYSAEEANDRQTGELIVGRHTDRRTLAKLQRWIDVEAGGEEEILVYDKNGDEIWISASVKAFRNERGQVKYMFGLLTDITESKQLRSLQQLIMGALPMKSRLPRSPTGCAGGSSKSRPTWFPRCSISTPADWYIRWALPACPTIIPGRWRASRSVRISAVAGPRHFSASRYWRWISTPIRAGSPSKPGRSKSVCAPAGRRRSSPRMAASSAPSRSISGNAARQAAGINASSTPASISARSRSSARKPAPRSHGSLITTC